MAKLSIYNLEGKSVGAIDLAPEVFEVKPKKTLIHDVVVALEGNMRQVLAHTKTRGEVRGGGKKPWKQKGTGRARAGSIRSPLWRGGSVLFGPTKDRNFKVKINKKAKKLAFRMVLSQKFIDKEIVALENFNLGDLKTKSFINLKKNLLLSARKILIVLPSGDVKNIRLASRNIPCIKQVSLAELNLLDLLKTDSVLFTKDAVEYLNKTYSKK